MLLLFGMLGGMFSLLVPFLTGYLYDVSTTDPVTFVLAPLIIAIFSMLACFVPACRAARCQHGRDRR